MAWYKYFSVEVPLLLCTFCFVLQGAVITNLYVYRTCYVILGYDESDCAQLGNKENNLTAWLEPKVQPVVNHINMVSSITSNLIPLIFCMFVGTWSDKFGRKPFLVLCLAGIILTTGMNTTIIHFKYMSPWWFIMSGIPSFLTGGYTTLVIVMSAYLADISTEKDRVIRLGIFEVIVALAAVIGNLCSSYLFYATSYETIYIMSTGLVGISFIYTIFFIPESLKSEKQKFSIRELITSINLKDIVKDTLRKRENNARPYILAIILAYTIYGMGVGELGMGTLFLRAKLHWTLAKITQVGSITGVINIFGTLFGTYVLYEKFKIKELHLCLMGILLVACADILRGIATNDYYIYSAYLCVIFFGMPALMLKSVLTFVVAPEEMGKIFALTNIIMSCDDMLSNLLYPMVYNATLDINSGLYNCLSLGIHLLLAIVIIFLTRVTFPRYQSPENQEIDQSKTPKLSINNFEVTDINDKRYSNRPSLNIIDTRRLSQVPTIF